MAVEDVHARPVPAQAYTEEYYLECCSGSDTFEESKGLALSPVTLELLDRLGVGPDTRVLDIGSGRGEVVFNAGKRGARAIGFDYADAALGLAQKMLGEHPDLEGRVLFGKADVKAMPVRRASIDIALMMDVVEHLQPWELDAGLAETFRVLKPGARLCVHTMPNRNYYRWVYQPLRLAGRLLQRGNGFDRDPRSEYEHQMHVNEQTPRGLKRSLERAGFDVELWVGGFEKVPLKRGGLYRLARAAALRTPLRTLAAFHIFAIATRPG